MVNINKLMKQAQQMQERVQREMAELVVEASAGGGMVTVKMTGHKQVVGVTIDREVVDPEDPGMLADLVLTPALLAGPLGGLIERSVQRRMASENSLPDLRPHIAPRSVPASK